MTEYEDKLRKITELRENESTAEEALKRFTESVEVKDVVTRPIVRQSAPRSTFVPPSGDVTTAKYFYCGEQPGTREVFRREPFVGPAGKILDECNAVAGIQRGEGYYTNFIKDKDKQLDYYIKLNLKEPLLSKEGLEYFQILDDELKRSNAKVIFAIGGAALFAIAGIKGITKWRGSILRNTKYAPAVVIPVLHPATVIPPKNVYLNKMLIQYDLRRGRSIVEGTHEFTQRTLNIKPTFDQAMQELKKIEERGLSGNRIDFDIELYNEEVSCISFSQGNGQAISIPFITWEGDYFTVEQEATIWQVICRLLENSKITKCAQNASFDSHFLLRRYGIKVRPCEDTMVAQRTIMPDYPIGLDFITSIWTDQTYYKEEGKRYFSGGGWEQLWKYNATDSLMCYEAFPKQLKRLEKQGNVEAYKRQSRMIEPLVYMQERGILVDVEGMKKAAVEMEDQVYELKEQLNKIAGRELNPNSPKQLKEYFYGAVGKGGKGHKAYKSRKTGSETTDDTAMKRLARKGFEEARLVLQVRKLVKLKGTYLNVSKIDPDGRIRSSYNPAGTKFSRLSSSANIFGTGMNMQNWPHDLLRFLLFDKGYMGYRIDLSQAENRIVAYVGDVTPMIEAFENNEDVHSLTAALIFGKSLSEVTTEDGTCPLGDGTHSERFWGKKANHGLNYDLGYRTFALYYEMMEANAKWIVDRYHYAYPGVRSNFHAYIKKSLAKNRTIENLMGRKTLFLGAMDDSLFKEAYSCIPQGTVGDVINERGVEFIYYNQQTFSPVELLIQVHDDIGFQIPLSLPWIEHAKILRRVKECLEIPLKTHRGREFVVPADVVMGHTLHKDSCKSIKAKSFPSTDEELAKLLEKNSLELV